MNRDDRILLTTGSTAALLGVAAGGAEIVAGTVTWAGNKNDPTTLGWVTILLGLIIGGSAMLAARSTRLDGARLASVAALVTCGLVGFTTAGLVWIPSALMATATLVVMIRRLHGEVGWGTAIATHWPAALIGVLAVIHLTFGIVARDGIGLLGVGGGVLACVALAVHRRSRRVAAGGLALAALPFAVATWWTVITPLTAAGMLAIGLPYVLGRSPAGAHSDAHAGPATGGAP